MIEESYIYDEKSKKEYSAEKILPRMGYTLCGRISCDMWRYMFANVSDVKDIGGESVKLSPALGKYVATNYFASSEHDSHKIHKFHIASRIKLQK